MDFFKHVESLMKYKIVKVIDVIVAVFVLFTFQSYIRRIRSGMVQFGVIHILLICSLLYVELFFLKRIKCWCFDQYLSVPGIKGIFSKEDIKELLSREDFICPKDFRGTFYEKHHMLYASRGWLCICNHFFHKSMIAAIESRCIKTHHTLGHNYLYIVLYTGEILEINCGDTTSQTEKWNDFLNCIQNEMGGFLLNEYIYKGFVYDHRELIELREMLRKEIRKQPDPKNWLLSGAAIEFYKDKLDKEIKAKEEYIESTGSRRNDAIADRRRRLKEEKTKRKQNNDRR